MPGTRIPGKSVADVIKGGSVATLTSLLPLTLPTIATFNGRVAAVKAYAATAGTGPGSSVLDVQINGQSIWSVAAQRPTLPSASTGEFNNAIGSRGSFRAGDIITASVATLGVTGHSNVAISVALQAA